MPDKCDIAKENVDILKEADELREEQSLKNTKVVASSIENDLKMREHIRKTYPKGEFLSESDLNQLFNEIYGKKSDRVKLANKINGLMEANESLKSYMNIYIAENIPEGVKIAETREYVDDEGNKTTKKVMVLANLPKGTLKNILQEALTPGTWQDSKLGFWGHPLNFDGIMSHILTQKQKSRREPSGAYWQIVKGTEDYPTNVSARINTFTSESFAGSTHGMNAIYERIANISRFGDSTRMEEKKLTRLFTRYMMGWIYKDKNTGKWMIYKDYMLREDENGRAMTYGKDGKGDYKFGYQNPVELKDYTPPEGEKGSWYVDFDSMSKPKQALDEFFKFAENARKIDDEVFKYMQENMTKAVDELVQELYTTFKMSGLTKNQVKQIFFNPNIKASKKIIKSLNKPNKKMYKNLFDTFGTIINDQFVIANGGKILFPNEEGHRKNHWPVIYDRTVFGHMIKKLIKELDARVKGLKLDLKTGVDKEGNPYTSEERAEIKDKILNYSEKLENAIRINDNRLNYNEDGMEGVTVPFVSDNKYMKNISNAYDIRQARTDEGVYYEYLKHVMSSIERNILSAKLVKALRISSENNSKKMDNVVIDESINLFKTIFNTPDVNGPFSRISGMKTFSNVENINSFLNKVNRFRNRTPQQLNNTYRIINNVLTSTYLGGVFTTLQNVSDKYRNTMHFGMDAFRKGEEELNHDIRGPFWEELIQMSGVTEFSDFFSRSMVNSITEIQLELDVTEGIFQEMWKYWKAIDDNTNEDDAEKQFRENIKKYLAQSNSVLAADEIVIQDRDALKQEEKEIKQQKRLALTNKLVNLAITKQYVARDAFKKPGFKAAISKSLKGPAEGAIDLYKKYFNQFGLTMSDTERYIRSVSFVIGVNRAIETGLLDGPIDNILKNEEEIATAIFYGQTYNKLVNFQLSTQAIGKYGQGGHGKFWAKFKTWSTQKFGSDTRLFRNAYRVALSRKDKNKSSYNPIVIAKTWGKVLKQMGLYPGGKKARAKYNRTTSNEIATLRAFVVQQGLTTVAFDILTLGVFPALGPLRSFMYFSTGTRALRGYTSDLVSFMMMIPLLVIKSLAGGGGDDEDKDLQRTLTYYLRKTQWGFGAVWTYDLLQAMYLGVMGENSMAYDKFLDWTAPMRGGNTVFGRSSTGLLKMLDEDKED